jgi:hypothetical protein
MTQIESRVINSVGRPETEIHVPSDRKQELFFKLTKKFGHVVRFIISDGPTLQ